jgi:hypothetical protein
MVDHALLSQTLSLFTAQGFENPNVVNSLILIGKKNGRINETIRDGTGTAVSRED